MRVLFTVWPLPAHLYPMLPLAWALQGAGHEVCIASHPALTDAITSAGFPAVALGTADTIPELSAVPQYLLDSDERQALGEAIEVGEDDLETWNMFSQYMVASMRVFHTIGDGRCGGVDDLADFVRDWKADLVLWDVVWPGAAVAARAAGAAQARLLWGPDYVGWAKQRFDRFGVADDPVRRLMEPVARRYGLEVDDELLLGQWTVDPTPVAARLPVHTNTVSMRRVPYTGAAVSPGWLYPRPERPRVALSLGASGRPFNARNAALISDVLDAVADLDVEVVGTLNAMELEGLTVPPNVRTIDYLPLNQLLPTCSAIIHHGGGGTLTSALIQQIPQLLVEGEGLESRAYARYLLEHGAGLTVRHPEHSVDELRKRLTRLLTEPAFTDGAARLYADWLSRPSPNDVVPQLEKLTALHR
jgi:glycosyltransferase (activator-dependent family)